MQQQQQGSSVPATIGGVVPPPHRIVGGVFVVTCNDHPFKHGWQVVRSLRDLRLEFRGQTSIHPDTPQVRLRLWRVRHVVRMERLDLDEVRELIGVPSHIEFEQLNRQLPNDFGRTKGTKGPALRSKMHFMQYRRMRLRDVLHRDAIEKRLLEEKRKVLMQQQQQQQSSA